MNKPLQPLPQQTYSYHLAMRLVPVCFRWRGHAMKPGQRVREDEHAESRFWRYSPAY